MRCTEEGRTGVQWEARNASGCGADKGADQRWTLDMINVHERSAFLDGRKLIAVISEAASAGISLHADKCAPGPLCRCTVSPPAARPSPRGDSLQWDCHACRTLSLAFTHAPVPCCLGSVHSQLFYPKGWGHLTLVTVAEAHHSFLVASCG